MLNICCQIAACPDPGMAGSVSDTSATDLPNVVRTRCNLDVRKMAATSCQRKEFYAVWGSLLQSVMVPAILASRTTSVEGRGSMCVPCGESQPPPGDAQCFHAASAHLDAELA